MWSDEEKFCAGEAAVSWWLRGARQGHGEPVGHVRRMVATRSATNRSVDELSLAEVEDIVLQDAELRQILLDLKERQAGGAAKGGRYNKHDTARLRFIRDKALHGVRWGMLVPEADLRMLRMPPQEELRQRGGADLAAMEEWAERHGRDPRSKKKDGEGLEQQTLLAWARRNVARFVEPSGARRGRPSSFKLDFGVYKGYTVFELAEHAAASEAHIIAAPAVATPRPGAYLLWLAGDAFEWQFPRHLKLFCALRALYHRGLVVREGGGQQALKLSARATRRYDAHVVTVLTPQAHDANLLIQ